MVCDLSCIIESKCMQYNCDCIPKLITVILLPIIDHATIIIIQYIHFTNGGVYMKRNAVCVYQLYR